MPFGIGRPCRQALNRRCPDGRLSRHIVDALNHDNPLPFRCTSMVISRRGDQKPTLRIDNGGIAHIGSDTLSALGEQIVDFVIWEDVLSRQSPEIRYTWQKIPFDEMHCQEN